MKNNFYAASTIENVSLIYYINIDCDHHQNVFKMVENHLVKFYKTSQ